MLDDYYEDIVFIDNDSDPYYDDFEEYSSIDNDNKYKDIDWSYFT